MNADYYFNGERKVYTLPANPNEKPSVVTYQLKYPVNLDTFNGFPTDIKQKYVDSMQFKYCMNLNMFKQSLGLDDAGIADLIKSNDIKFNFDVNPTPSQIKTWLQMIKNLKSSANSIKKTNSDDRTELAVVENINTNNVKTTWESLDNLNLEEDLSSDSLKEKIESDRGSVLNEYRPIPSRVSWAQFYNMTSEERVKHLKEIMEFFLASRTQIATDYFSIPRNALYDLVPSFSVYGREKIRMPKAMQKYWKKWVSGKYLDRNDFREIYKIRQPYLVESQVTDAIEKEDKIKKETEVTTEMPTATKTKAAISGAIHLEGNAAEVIETIKNLTAFISDTTIISVDLSIGSKTE